MFRPDNPLITPYLNPYIQKKIPTKRIILNQNNNDGTNVEEQETFAVNVKID